MLSGSSERPLVLLLVGWLVDDKHEGYIDFQMQNRQQENPPSVALTFNVDGIIYDKID